MSATNQSFDPKSVQSVRYTFADPYDEISLPELAKRIGRTYLREKYKSLLHWRFPNATVEVEMIHSGNATKTRFNAYTGREIKPGEPVQECIERWSEFVGLTFPGIDLEEDEAANKLRMDVQEDEMETDFRIVDRTINQMVREGYF